MNRDVERMLKVTTEIHNPAQNLTRPVAKMGKGMRSIYMLSLLETYTGTEGRIPSILMIEDPEIFLHPKLQKGFRGDFIPPVQKKPGDFFPRTRQIYWRTLTAGRSD